MNIPNQGSDSTIIDASPAEIFALLVDSQRLPEWMPAVLETTGDIEHQGAVRDCVVSMEGQHGEVREQCVVYQDDRRIGWKMVEDTLGFGKMLDEMGFDFVLEPQPGGGTRVINTTYFRPRNVLTKIVAALVLKRKFRSLRRAVLRNLSQLAASSPAGH